MDQESLSLVWEVTRTGGGVAGTVALVVLFARWVFGRSPWTWGFARRQPGGTPTTQWVPDPAAPVGMQEASGARDQFEPGFQMRLDKAEQEVKALCQVVLDERARADRYFRCIETIERERNEWHQAYDAASTGHANAQSLMMEEIGRLARRLERAKAALKREPPDSAVALAQLSEIEPHAGLKELAAQYRNEHGPDGIQAKIERSTPDLTPTEAAERDSRRARS